MSDFNPSSDHEDCWIWSKHKPLFPDQESETRCCLVRLCSPAAPQTRTQPSQVSALVPSARSSLPHSLVAARSEGDKKPQYWVGVVR